MAGRGMTFIHGNTKETITVIKNLKETRILEKSVQTLSLEQSYAAKILDLNQKMVRFNYSRMKKNVSKIHSHLNETDIAAMKGLESEGRLNTGHPRTCSSTNSTKIAAAQRRLKLDRYRRAQSAMPILNRRDTSTALSDDDHDTEENDTDELGSGYEPKVSCRRHRLKRPKTSICVGSTSSLDSDDNQSPKTNTKPKDASTALLERIAKAQKANKSHTPSSTFSCHDDKPSDMTDGQEKNPLKVFGPDPYEERRKKLITMETETLTGLDQKKQSFVNELKDFVKRNPMVVDYRPDRTQQVIRSIDSIAARPGSVPGRSRAVEGCFMQQLSEIRKSRYLRVDDTKLDANSTNTLAQNFLKQTEQWRRYATNAQPKSLRDSVLDSNN